MCVRFGDKAVDAVIIYRVPLAAVTSARSIDDDQLSLLQFKEGALDGSLAPEGEVLGPLAIGVVDPLAAIVAEVL